MTPGALGRRVGAHTPMVAGLRGAWTSPKELTGAVGLGWAAYFKERSRKSPRKLARFCLPDFGPGLKSS